MTIQRVMLVLGLCACGTTRGDGPIDDAGMGDGGGADSGSEADGGTGESTDINKSGTRIKMKVLNSPDGAKVFQGNYDSQRNEECAFQVASDGMTRCLPVGASVTYGVYFADANCTVPAGFAYPGCNTVPTYVTASPPATCPFSPTTGMAVYARGAVITSHYTKSGATCTLNGPLAGYTFYTSGALIPVSDFQSATIAIE